MGENVAKESGQHPVMSNSRNKRGSPEASGLQEDFWVSSEIWSEQDGAFTMTWV